MNRNFKRLIHIFLLIILLVGCKSINEENNTNKYIGYIRSVDDSTIELDDFEFITSEDTERIKELKLSDSDMPNGYYINNVSEETKSFSLTNETEFIFYDTGNLFVSEEDDKKYTTYNKDEFIEFLYLYSDSPRRTPFWVEVSNKDVIKIEEEFVN